MDIENIKRIIANSYSYSNYSDFVKENKVKSICTVKGAIINTAEELEKDKRKNKEYEEYFKNLGKFYARIYLDFKEGFLSEINKEDK